MSKKGCGGALDNANVAGLSVFPGIFVKALLFTANVKGMHLLYMLICDRSTTMKFSY